jgi:hypothetical protein
MPTPFESAQLNLQLFDLRRETVLREARRWRDAMRAVVKARQANR